MSKENVVNQVKIWITPSVIGILGMFIWRDLGELREDVKTLLARTSEDHLHLQHLDQDVQTLKERVWDFYGPKGQNTPASTTLYHSQLLATKPEDNYLTLNTNGNEKRH